MRPDMQERFGWQGSEVEILSSPMPQTLSQYGKSGTPEYWKNYYQAHKQQSGALDTASMRKVGGQSGSNPGGLYEASDGTRYYIKQGRTPDHVSNEMLAAKLYEEAGAAVPELSLATYNGKPGIASKIVPTQPVSPDALKALPGVHENFAADAWLANWDVAGLGFDNLKSSGGKAMRLDTGGALEYRAMGSKKGSAFGDSVGELKSMRDKSLNPQAARVFGSISPAALQASIGRVTRISDERITQLVQQHWPSNPALAQKLIRRKHSMQQVPLGLSQYGRAGTSEYYKNYYEAHKDSAVETPAEIAALESYQDLSDTLNVPLRREEVLGQKAEQKVRALDSLIDKQLPVAVPVYRGVDSNIFDNLEEGRVFTDLGFVSTSADRKIADTFALGGGGVISFKPNGRLKGADVNSLLGDRSAHPTEKEIILPRNARFRVVRKIGSSEAEVEAVA